MNELPDDLNYHELKAELRILQGKVEDLNARLNGVTPAVPSAQWQLAAGFLILAGAVAQAVAGKFKGDSEAAGKVKAGLAIEAGNSDIYFTKTDHLFTAAADTSGNAAIENSSNYNGLMILGRSTAAGRIIRMWDSVGIRGTEASTVAAPLDVKGQGRKQMTRTDRSVCFLTTVTGYFYGGGERVEIVADNGYWYLQGKSQTRDVGAVARCIGAPDNSC